MNLIKNTPSYGGHEKARLRECGPGSLCDERTDACEEAFRDPQTFSNAVQGTDNPANE